MISRILEADNLGLLNGFKWDNAIDDFKKFNIFYGWNYSGKTTLSRVFSNFEASQRHQDYPSCSSKILTDDGLHYDCETWGCPHPIRVFNTDFIETNLKWDFQIEPILLIGEENIKLQEELKTLREQQIQKRKKATDTGTKANSLENSIDEKLTEKARQIKNTLSIPNYNKRNLNPVISQIGGDLQLLDDESLKNHIDDYRSTDKKPEITSINLSVPDIEKNRTEVASLVQTKVISKTIQKLKDDRVLSAWVRQGKDIHAGKQICEFCGKDLPVGLLDTLNDHFSDQYEKHIRSLDSAISALKNDIVEYTFPDKANFYQELTVEYVQLRDEANRLIDEYNENVKVLIKILEEKKSNPFDEIKSRALKSNGDLSESIAQINDLIKNHNNQSDSFETRKVNSLSLLEKHFASEFMEESKYAETKSEIARLRQQVQQTNSEIQQIDSQCAEIELKLSETVKGAEKINEYLQSYFGRGDISIKVNENDTFQLYRGNNIAKNLSEGEKTAISFAYFVTKLEEKGTDLEKTVVYIDDPVSSLDSNHLFSTYSFIKNKLTSSHQLFISTHNFEFLNLLKDWLINNSSFKNKTSVYWIERCERSGNFYACIINMPRELIAFKSEYHYLFSILYSFHNNPVSDHGKLYVLPNLVRRFLEAYLGFKIPKHAGLHAKLNDFIQDEIKTDKIQKFVDQYSHNTSLPRSLMFPDLSECRECMTIIIDRLKSYDQDHFDYLVAEIRP